MKAEKQVIHEGRLAQAREYVEALENGDGQKADQVLVEIANTRETQLFREIGKLTRQLHDSMTEFALDAKLAEFTEKDIPDAKERLNYVISMTQEAADTTLCAIEDIIPLTEDLGGLTQELNEKWARFRRKEMELSEFKAISIDLPDYFSKSMNGLNTIQSRLNEVLLAQGFQDITGQIIKRVINLVHDVELSMVELIRITGGTSRSSNEPKQDEKPELAGPVVPSLDEGNSVACQDEVDDLLSSLGF